MKNVSIVYIITILLMLATSVGCSSINKTKGSQKQPELIAVNSQGAGPQLEISLIPGKHHNYPTFAIWVETLTGEYIQTLFVTKSLGTGYYGHGALATEKWDNHAGPQSRPATLPYWLHKRLPKEAPFQLPTPKDPVPDAYTGATPKASALIHSRTDHPLPERFRLVMEVNQPWDWNDFWHNTKYDDPDYRTSCQPSLLYFVTIDSQKSGKEYTLNPFAHGHPTGKSGELYTNISTLTTAKEIFSTIIASIK